MGVIQRMPYKLNFGETFFNWVFIFQNDSNGHLSAPFPLQRDCHQDYPIPGFYLLYFQNFSLLHSDFRSEVPITKDELDLDLKDMNNNKSPELDGYSPEFKKNVSHFRVISSLTALTTASQKTNLPNPNLKAF